VTATADFYDGPGRLAIDATDPMTFADAVADLLEVWADEDLGAAYLPADGWNPPDQRHADWIYRFHRGRVLITHRPSATVFVPVEPLSKPVTPSPPKGVTPVTTNPGYPPTDHRDDLDELRRVLPGDTVMLAPPDDVPLRAPDGAWGLVVIAMHTTRATGIPDLAAGRWLPEPPPAELHAGDVVVRLHPPGLVVDPNLVDVEVLTAHHDHWSSLGTWPSLGPAWPHEIAVPLLANMRALADAASRVAQWATLTGPIAAALADERIAADLGIEPLGPADRLRVHAPDALAALIDAGLLTVGEHLVFDGHTATVGHGGVLHDGPPYTDDVSAVSALATSLTGTTLNGWHVWRRVRDHRLLAELRTDLATTR
jgi:hypothetical protein